MQYVFLIRSSTGGKKYVTRLRLVTYFLPPALERIKNTYCMGQRPFLYLYWHSTVAMALSCIAPEMKCDIGGKSQFFHTLSAFNARVKETPSKFCHNISCGKTRIVGLPDGKNEDAFTCFNTIHEHDKTQTDRQTDKQTARRTDGYHTMA